MFTPCSAKIRASDKDLPVHRLRFLCTKEVSELLSGSRQAVVRQSSGSRYNGKHLCFKFFKFYILVSPSEQNSGVILTSMGPNIFGILFSIKKPPVGLL
jgi:hypothetical protein